MLPNTGLPMHGKPQPPVYLPQVEGQVPGRVYNGGTSIKRSWRRWKVPLERSGVERGSPFSQLSEAFELFEPNPPKIHILVDLPKCVAIVSSLWWYF